MAAPSSRKCRRGSLRRVFILLLRRIPDRRAPRAFLCGHRALGRRLWTESPRSTAPQRPDLSPCLHLPKEGTIDAPRGARALPFAPWQRSGFDGGGALRPGACVGGGGG